VSLFIVIAPYIEIPERSNTITSPLQQMRVAGYTISVNGKEIDYDDDPIIFDNKYGEAEIKLQNKSVKLVWEKGGLGCNYFATIQNGDKTKITNWIDVGNECNPKRLELFINTIKGKITEIIGNASGKFIEGLILLVQLL
jgi:hypothetical protein